MVIGVPDDAIPGRRVIAAADGFRSTGKAHLSGPRAGVAPARAAGARRSPSIPQTFPDGAALDLIPGCAMAVTADDAEAYTIGSGSPTMARLFRLDGAQRLYHAAAVFASNYLIVTGAIAEDPFRRAGVRPDGAMSRWRASLTTWGTPGPGRPHGTGGPAETPASRAQPRARASAPR